jgi:endonuclease I
MNTKLYFFLGIVFCLSLVKPSEAQYLKVKSKKAKIRTVAALNGNVVEEVTKGTILIILQEARASTNNYYKVKCSNFACEGWIVQTAVKRIKGEIPEEVFAESKYATNLFGIGQVPEGFYDEAENLEGHLLKRQLHLLTRNHKIFSYNEIYTILESTDQDPHDTTHVVLLYTAKSVQRKNKDRGGRYDYSKNAYTYQDAWNREHVWPKSFGFPNESDTAYSDLHHIRPADRTINSHRNNRSFDYGTIPYFDNDGTIATECFMSEGWTWEPPDFVKGDIARMIFYMAVRYEGYNKNGEWIGDLEIVDEIPPKNSKEPTFGKLSALLEWHQSDPVDNWERRRNDIIFKKYQGNRNPFIDHPEFVSRIWTD